MGLSARRCTIWGAALMASLLCCACGGERSARPDAGAAAGKAAQGPVVVAFVDEAPRALNVDEEAVFVAAVVELLFFVGECPFALFFFPDGTSVRWNGGWAFA